MTEKDNKPLIINNIGLSPVLNQIKRNNQLIEGWKQKNSYLLTKIRRQQSLLEIDSSQKIKPIPGKTEYNFRAKNGELWQISIQPPIA